MILEQPPAVTLRVPGCNRAPMYNTSEYVQPFDCCLVSGHVGNHLPVRCFPQGMNIQAGYSRLLGGCPFNGPLSGMKYPTRTKSTTRRCIVVRSRSRSCGGGDPA